MYTSLMAGHQTGGHESAIFEGWWSKPLADYLASSLGGGKCRRRTLYLRCEREPYRCIRAGMTQRVEGGQTYTQVFDAENRLISVTVNGQTTQFVYDGNGNPADAQGRHGQKDQSGHEPDDLYCRELRSA
jgi:hypothetical protein